jgi:hypothetical protein
LVLLFVDKDSLLPFARGLIGAVNASNPAAGALLSFEQFPTGSLNAALPRCCLLCVINPANKLVSTKRRQRLPKGKYFRI